MPTGSFAGGYARDVDGWAFRTKKIEAGDVSATFCTLDEGQATMGEDGFQREGFLRFQVRPNQPTSMLNCLLARFPRNPNRHRVHGRCDPG